MPARAGTFLRQPRRPKPDDLSGVLLEKSRQRAGCLRRGRSLRESNFVRFPSSFDRFTKGLRHSNRVGSNGNRGIDQNRVGAHLERLRRLTRRAKSRVDYHRHSRLLDDNFDLRVCVSIPRLLPIGEPSGMTVAVPTSCKRFASTGSALI